jgi:hypothetical protein
MGFLLEGEKQVMGYDADVDNVHNKKASCRTASYSKNEQNVSLLWIVLQLPKAAHQQRDET